MMRTTLLVLFSGLLIQVAAQLEPLRYAAEPQALPTWVQLMYADDPDPGAVQAAYDAYYATHPRCV